MGGWVGGGGGGKFAPPNVRMPAPRPLTKRGNCRGVYVPTLYDNCIQEGAARESGRRHAEEKSRRARARKRGRGGSTCGGKSPHSYLSCHLVVALPEVAGTEGAGPPFPCSHTTETVSRLAFCSSRGRLSQRAKRATTIIRRYNEVIGWKKDGPVRPARRLSGSRWSPKYPSVAFKAAETSELVLQVHAEGAGPCAESGQE